MPSVDKPVFVIGTGRCGLSLVTELLACHEYVAWFSQWTDRFPRSRIAPCLPYWLHKPGLRHLALMMSAITRRHLVPHPDESFRAFLVSFRGFARSYRPLTALDVDQNARRGIYATVLAHVCGQRKKRFVAELSGWARIHFLRDIFPDARFIHVVRDARATVNSLLNVDWWDGWYGECNSRYGPIPEKYRALVFNGEPSFAALAAAHYNVLLDNILDEARSLDESSYLEIRFEDVVRETENAVARLCRFAELPITPRYALAWRRIKVFDPNNSVMRIAPWRENLAERQQQLIARACHDYLRRFDYIAQE